MNIDPKVRVTIMNDYHREQQSLRFHSFELFSQPKRIFLAGIMTILGISLSVCFCLENKTRIVRGTQGALLAQGLGITPGGL